MCRGKPGRSAHAEYPQAAGAPFSCWSQIFVSIFAKKLCHAAYHAAIISTVYQMGCSSSVDTTASNGKIDPHAMRDIAAAEADAHEARLEAQSEAERAAAEKAVADELDSYAMKGSWDAEHSKKGGGTSTAGRSEYDEKRHKAALAIQGAQRQRAARDKANAKRHEKAKKKKQEQADEEARRRTMYGPEHDAAATTIQSAQRTKVAHQKVKKKRTEKGDIGGIGIN